MSDDTLPTIWEADPHTLAKLRILEAYLKAWMPILSRLAKSKRGLERVVYIDAFSGPGRYSSGEKGSPLVAIEVAANFTPSLPVQIKMVFIEKRQDRWEQLERTLKDQAGRHRNLYIPRPLLGSAKECLGKIFKFRSAEIFVPTLVFLDQFGYSAVPMELAREIMSKKSCEIFSFMNWRDLNRYMTDETKWNGINRAFGGDEWKEVLEIQDTSKSRRFLQLYEKALRIRGGVEFLCTFSMHGNNGELIYWLVFCTNNIRGLEEMKKAMWKVDTSGEFKFSDRHSGQLRLLPGFNDEWLAQSLHQDLLGKEISLPELRLFVLTQTPCYKFSESLATLEKEKKLRVIRAPQGRRAGSFVKYQNDENYVVRFENPEIQLGLWS